MHWLFLICGCTILITGIVITIAFETQVKLGPLEELNQNLAIAQFGGIISGVGFILMLASFGLKRRRKSKPGKDMSTKPDESN